MFLCLKIDEKERLGIQMPKDFGPNGDSMLPRPKLPCTSRDRSMRRQPRPGPVAGGGWRRPGWTMIFRSWLCELPFGLL
jgi:hypothetical protein